jgi:arylsulfatase A-like enzyme
MPPSRRADDSDWHPYLAPARASGQVGSTVVGFPDLAASEATTGMIRALYFGLATEVDTHIGRLIQWLKDSGQYDDTLIVLTADHGEMLGDYDQWGKRSFQDACFHVPLIIRDPQATARGLVIDAPTESIDVTPTILEALGVSVPHSMDGRGLGAFLDGDTPEDWRTHSYSELDFGDPLTPTPWQKQLGLPLDAANLAVLRKGSLRLVQFAGGLPPILMDVENGGEAVNLAQNPGQMQTMLDLMQDMLCHRMMNTEGTFSRTLITDRGVQVAS